MNRMLWSLSSAAIVLQIACQQERDPQDLTTSETEFNLSGTLPDLKIAPSRKVKKPPSEGAALRPPLEPRQSKAPKLPELGQRIRLLASSGATSVARSERRKSISLEVAKIEPMIAELKALFPTMMQEGGGSSKIPLTKGATALESYATTEEYLRSLPNKPGGDIRHDIYPGFYSMQGFILINGYYRAKLRGLSDEDALISLTESLSYEENYGLKYDLSRLLIAANSSESVQRIVALIKRFDLDLEMLPKSRSTVFRLDKLERGGSIPSFFTAPRTGGALSTAAVLSGAINGAKDSDQGTKNFALRIFTPIGSGGSMLRYGAFTAESERLFRHASQLHYGLLSPARRIKSQTVDENGFLRRPPAAAIGPFTPLDPEGYATAVFEANQIWARAIIGEFSANRDELASEGDTQLLHFARQLMEPRNRNHKTGIGFDGDLVQFISIDDPTSRFVMTIH